MLTDDNVDDVQHAVGGGGGGGERDSGDSGAVEKENDNNNNKNHNPSNNNNNNNQKHRLHRKNDENNNDDENDDEADGDDDGEQQPGKHASKVLGVDVSRESFDRYRRRQSLYLQSQDRFVAMKSTGCVRVMDKKDTVAKDVAAVILKKKAHELAELNNQASFSGAAAVVAKREKSLQQGRVREGESVVAAAAAAAAGAGGGSSDIGEDEEAKRQQRQHNEQRQVPIDTPSYDFDLGAGATLTTSRPSSSSSATARRAQEFVSSSNRPGSGGPASASKVLMKADENVEFIREGAPPPPPPPPPRSLPVPSPHLSDREPTTNKSIISSVVHRHQLHQQQQVSQRGPKLPLQPPPPVSQDSPLSSCPATAATTPATTVMPTPSRTLPSKLLAAKLAKKGYGSRSSSSSSNHQQRPQPNTDDCQNQQNQNVKSLNSALLAGSLTSQVFTSSLNPLASLSSIPSSSSPLHVPHPPRPTATTASHNNNNSSMSPSAREFLKYQQEKKKVAETTSLQIVSKKR